MTRARTWPPVWAADNNGHTHVAAHDGRPFRCYSGVWCVQTMSGEWRSALWLGVVGANGLARLEATKHVPGPSALPGQQSLLQEED